MTLAFSQIFHPKIYFEISADVSGEMVDIRQVGVDKVVFCGYTGNPDLILLWDATGFESESDLMVSINFSQIQVRWIQRLIYLCRIQI